MILSWITAKTALKSEFTKSLFWMAELFCKCVVFYGQDISSLQIVWHWGFYLFFFFLMKQQLWILIFAGYFKFLSWHTLGTVLSEHRDGPSQTASFSFILKGKALPGQSALRAQSIGWNALRYCIPFWVLKSPQVENSDQSQRTSCVLIANFSMQFLPAPYC